LFQEKIIDSRLLAMFLAVSIPLPLLPNLLFSAVSTSGTQRFSPAKAESMSFAEVIWRRDRQNSLEDIQYRT
jgi:hypothetical protein